MAPEKEPSSPARSPLSPLALLGILASSLVIIGWFRSRSPKNEVVKAEHPRDNANSESESSQEQATIASEVYPSPNQQYETRCRPDQTPWARWILEAFGLAIAIGILIVTYVQSVATQRAAEAARDSANAVISTMHVDEMPWVVVRMDSRIQLHNTIPPSPILASIVIVNTGKTPAKKIDGNIAVSVLDKNSVPDFNYGSGHVRYQLQMGAMFRDDPHVLQIPAMTVRKEIDKPEPVLLTKELHNRINEGDSYIAVNGRIDFWDVFDVHHWVTFCRVAQGSNGQQKTTEAQKKCIEYNGFDPNIVAK